MLGLHNMAIGGINRLATSREFLIRIIISNNVWAFCRDKKKWHNIEVAILEGLNGGVALTVDG